MKKKRRRYVQRANPIIPEDKCIVRVVQVRRSPSKSDGGVRRRPRIIKEVVDAWYHRCDWCQGWFRPTKRHQRYCDYLCRHSAFRDRRREELNDLRKRAGVA